MSMRISFSMLWNKIYIPICVIFICYFLFEEELSSLPYINSIRWGILGLGIFFLVCSWSAFQHDCKTKKIEKRLRKRGLISFLYFHSEYIINYTFYIYFFLYLVLKLDQGYIIYNYFLLLFFGMFVGFRISVKSDSYLK